MKRRDFIYQSGLLSAASVFTGLPQKAISDSELSAFLSQQGIAENLLERGKPTTYLKSKNELQYIGMPVGGILCGMVYLGGDGRLWLWDVFNKNQTGVIYKDVAWPDKIQGGESKLRPFDGANYVVPVKDVRPVEQGFAFCFEFDGQKIIKKLEAGDWDEIAFEATYPMAAIHYTSKDIPAEITIRVYSPFIPLNEDDSGLPATIYSFHIKNKSGKPLVVSVAGWLENKSSMYTAMDEQYYRVNKAEIKDNVSTITGTTNNQNWADDNFPFLPDYGDFSLSSLNASSILNTSADPASIDAGFFSKENVKESRIRFDQQAIGSVCNRVTIAAAASTELHYSISWYFPNLSFRALKHDSSRYYANKFKSSADVNAYINANFERLSSLTKLWCDNYYTHSTLPYWFLERTFLNISTLATTTCHRFASGRFYAWEGVGSCAGTCAHVWQYAQAMARIFPALERDTRQRVDLGIAFYEDGHIGFRGEYDEQPAIDGQAGRILGIYREHRTSSDNSFLQRQWPNTKKAIEFVLKQDRTGNGMVDSQLENTLDAKWPGEIAWLVGLCLAAVKAGQLMAEEMNDPAFAETCKSFFEKGKTNMEHELFNGEYFIHKADPKLGKTVLGSYNTCHIDQVYGQSWAYQAGIRDRIIDKQKTLSALKALWKYNFLDDVGPYIKIHRGGRPYALAGEGGMLMNTNPTNEDLPYGVKEAWQMTYFHECMSGFEHQVAAHMMAEGMANESLQLTKAIHDRYHALKRNPFNEVECSDHYARAMASYGTYITACGFEYHGPKGVIRFAPQINNKDFSAAFTAAEGWGSFSQQKSTKKLTCQLTVVHGKLLLNSIRLGSDNSKRTAVISVDTRKIKGRVRYDQQEVIVDLEKPVTISAGQKLSISLT